MRRLSSACCLRVAVLISADIEGFSVGAGEGVGEGVPKTGFAMIADRLSVVGCAV